MKISNRSTLIKFFCLSVMTATLLAGCGKGCGKKSVEKADIESFALIPADSNVVMGLNWEKLAGSPLGDKIKKDAPPDFAPFMDQVEGMILGLNVTGMGGEPKDFVAVIQGKFDQEALVAQMSEQAKKEGTTLESEEYSGINIYTSPKDARMGVAFLGSGVIVGKKEGVKKSIDLSNNKGESIKSKKSIMDMIGEIDTGKMLWAVGIVPEGALPGGSGAGAGPLGAFAAVKAIDLAVDYTKELTVDLGIIAGAEEEAKEMLTMANSYKTLFGTSLAQQNPNLGKLFGNLTLEVSGKRLAIHLKLDEATVQELSEQAKQSPLGSDMDMSDEPPLEPAQDQPENPAEAQAADQ